MLSSSLAIKHLMTFGRLSASLGIRLAGLSTFLARSLLSRPNLCMASNSGGASPAGPPSYLTIINHTQTICNLNPGFKINP